MDKLLNEVKENDLIICSELSRLGRSLFMIMDILHICLNKGCRVWTIKDNYRLGDDIQSKVLAFAFGLSAEIERNLISQRTIEALARKKSQGVVLGRPKGRKTDIKLLKCYKYRQYIMNLRADGYSFSEIGRRLHIHRITIAKFFILKK